MIIREIAKSPLSEISTFDWFNDFKDTREWAVRNCPQDIVTLLDAGHAVWLRGHNEEMRKKIANCANNPQ